MTPGGLSYGQPPPVRSRHANSGDRTPRPHVLAEKMGPARPSQRHTIRDSTEFFSELRIFSLIDYEFIRNLPIRKEGEG